MSIPQPESEYSDPDRTSLLLRTRDFLASIRLPLLIVGHLVIFAALYWVAFLMRFTLKIPETYQSIYWQGLPFVVSLKLVVFYCLGSFHGWWRHVNFSDFISLLRSAAAALSLIHI